MVAAIFFGRDAFTKYSAISMLVNLPATIFATAVYEVILRDSFAIIAKGHGQHEDGDDGLVRHLTKVGTLEEGITTSVLRGEGNEWTDGPRNGKKEISSV